MTQSEDCTIEDMAGGVDELTPEFQEQTSLSLQERAGKVVVIAGPTGVGKTEFSLELALLLGGEIVSADSMQVYRGMDIGTAKATEEQQCRVPHHLLDIWDVNHVCNVADYAEKAVEACRSILARNRVPIVVGGSGFYIQALMYGAPLGPPSDPQVRLQIERLLEIRGVECLYDRIREIDPEYASSITPNDRHKIVRALEIMKLTGNKVSFYGKHQKKSHQEFRFLPWFFHRPREVLYERIHQRCEQMLEQGLVDEVKHLIDLGIEQNPTASQAIGYRHVLEYLKSEQTEMDKREFLETFTRDTRRYAKRQLTWFRKQKEFRWVDIELIDRENVLDAIHSDYESAL